MRRSTPFSCASSRFISALVRTAGTFRARCAWRDRPEVVERLPEEVAVEEEERAEGMILRGRADLPFIRQAGEKPRHLRAARRVRMPLAGEDDEPPDSSQVRLLRAQRVVLRPEQLTHLLQKTGRLPGPQPWGTLAGMRFESADGKSIMQEGLDATHSSRQSLFCEALFLALQI